jgi:hypothetical protein
MGFCLRGAKDMQNRRRFASASEGLKCSNEMVGRKCQGERTCKTIAGFQRFHGASNADRGRPLETKRRRLQRQFKPVRAKPNALGVRIQRVQTFVEVSGEIIKETRTVSCRVRLEERGCHD